MIKFSNLNAQSVFINYEIDDNENYKFHHYSIGTRIIIYYYRQVIL